MKYRIEENGEGVCRIQTRGVFPFVWVYVKKYVRQGEFGRWVVWTGTYEQAFAECKNIEKKNQKPKYYYPPLSPPFSQPKPWGDPIVTKPPYHPGEGSILLEGKEQFRNV